MFYVCVTGTSFAASFDKKSLQASINGQPDVI